jgi:V/A-type H+-transporting ATPase subunit D
MPEIVPTHSAYLELQEERRSMEEGYRFLDEKRLVLAGEIVSELQQYEQDRHAFDVLYGEALQALRGAVGRHGLEGLTLYPALSTPEAHIRSSSRSVLGVPVSEARLLSGRADSEPAIHPSPEAEHCRRLFLQVLEAATALAARTTSLERLWEEYRRTSRRARALEDVLLPEMAETLRLLDAGLEEQDREEAIRVRYFKRRAAD